MVWSACLGEVLAMTACGLPSRVWARHPCRMDVAVPVRPGVPPLTTVLVVMADAQSLTVRQAVGLGPRPRPGKGGRLGGFEFKEPVPLRVAL